MFSLRTELNDLMSTIWPVHKRKGVIRPTDHGSVDGMFLQNHEGGNL